jgi:Tol biopolymer transport system component
VIGTAALASGQLYRSLAGASQPDKDPLGRWNGGFTLAASAKNAVLLVRSRHIENLQQLLLVDFETGNRTRLNSEGAHLASPYLSPDGTRLLFSRQPTNRQGHDLISCETSTLVCRTILKSTGSIHSAIEISGGRILYVSSPYVKRSDDQIRLTRNDIWLFDPVTGPRQLTDFRLYQLHSLSVTDRDIYFAATGPLSARPVIPKYDPSSNHQSSIFRLPFDSATGNISSPSGMMSPLFASAGIATMPGASADGSVIAFLRTRTGINPYRYELVIADQATHIERLINTSGMGFSRPVIIGHDVYSSVTRDDRVQIRVDRPNEAEMALLADIDGASVASAETVELKIAP